MEVIIIIIIRCAYRTRTPPKPLHCRGEARWRRLSSENISYKSLSPSRNVNGSGKLTVDPHPNLDQRQNLIISLWSPLAHYAYHVWLTSVNAFVSYPAHSQTKRTNDRQTDRQQRSRNSALVE